MDIFDRIASEFKKEARIPKGDKGAYKEWKENLEKKNPSAAEEWAKYEGAFDPSTGQMNEARIKENEGKGKGKGKDISALGQMGSKKAHFDDFDLLDPSFLKNLLKKNPRSLSLKEMVKAFRYLERRKGDVGLTREEEAFYLELKRMADRENLTLSKPSNYNDSYYATNRVSWPKKNASEDDEIIDDLGLDRYASEDDEIIDDLGLDRYASQEDGFFFKKRR